jgi:hypothetical protein
VRTYQSGRHSGDSQRLLNELSAARLCLLNPEKKAAYDAQLRAKLGTPASAGQAALLPFGFFVKGAAQYLAIQTRRFWIVQRRLTAGYRELGQSVFHEGRYRDRLALTYTLLEAVSKHLESLAQVDRTIEPAPPSPPEPIATQPGFLSRLWAKLRAMLLGFQRRRLLVRLGRGAFEIDPARCGPEVLVQSIRQQQVQLQELRRRIAELSEVPPGQVLSPRRLAWIVLGVMAIVVLLFFALRLGL